MSRTRSPLTSLLLVVAVLSATQAALAATPPRVVASIPPLHSLAAGLMEGLQPPHLLIDGTTTPWDYAPDEADRRRVAQADLLLWTGPELEPGLAQAVGAGTAGDVVEVLADDIVKVLPSRHDDRLRDPFFWLDTRNMLLLMDALAERLIARDPVRAHVYRRNWQTLNARLSALDRRLEFRYREVTDLPVFFYHDTHQYFEQAYAMHVAGYVESPGDTQTARAARLLDVRLRLAGQGETCLFTDRLRPAPHLDLLRPADASTVVALDSLGLGLAPGPELYPRLMEAQFDAIADCIARRRPDDTTAKASAAVAADVPDIRRFPDTLQPRYTLRDPFGRVVSSSDFLGRFQLIAFGYTFCPDVCPTSLAEMTRVLKLLGDDADLVQPIFITVDPGRDKPEVLAEYARFFHPRLLALSADADVTRRTAELFRARYEIVPSESGDPDRYVVDHTASIYLVGQDGEFITKFAYGLPAAEMATRLRDLIDSAGDTPARR